MTTLDRVRPWAAAWLAASLPFSFAYLAAGQPFWWALVPGAFCVLGVLAYRWVHRWQDARGFDEALAQHWLTTHRDEPLYFAPEPDGTDRLNAELRAEERRRYGEH